MYVAFMGFVIVVPQGMTLPRSSRKSPEWSARSVWGKEGVSILKFTSTEMLETSFLGNDLDNVSTRFMPGINGIEGGPGVVRRV